jgi:hypothetical protein
MGVSVSIKNGQIVFTRTVRKTVKKTYKAPTRVAPKPTRKVRTMKALVLPLIRHALAASAGALVARGYLDAAGSEMLIGAGLGVANFAWYMIERVLAKKAA